MRAFISISYSKRKSLSKEISAISDVLSDVGIEAFVFANEYTFVKNEEKKMMSQAIMDIDNSDILIAEVSEKAIGVGIEVGYAKAKGKPIIYIKNQSAEHSTTVSGISDCDIGYENENDLKNKLAKGLKLLLKV